MNELATEATTMAAFPIDPTKIDNNPFSDDAYLRRELERFARFFEGIPKDADDLHAGWNRFKKRHGDAAVIQLSAAIDTLERLHSIHHLLKGPEDDGIGGLLIVFHIALLELIEQGHYVGFPDWLLGRMKNSDPPLPTAVTVGAMKKYLKSQKQAYESEHGAAKSVIRAFQKGLTAEDKRTLLMAFKFSLPYPVPEEKRGLMHVHCRELMADGKPAPPNCMTCSLPVDVDLDRFIAPLARHLYAMRSAFFHRAAWVWFAGIEIPMEGVPPTGEGDMMDGYYDKDNRLVIYHVKLQLEDLVLILRRCAWNRLAQEAPVGT